MRQRQSEIAIAQLCRRAHHFEYTLGVVPVAVGPRRPLSGQRDAGSAAHKGVEVINKGGYLDEALDAVTEYVNMLRAIRQPEGWVPPPLTKEDDKEWWEIDRLGRAMTTNYVDWLGEGNDVGVKVLAVEHEWEQQVPGTGHSIYGMIDVALYDDLLPGDVIRDNKSVADFSKPPQAVDFQLRTYAWAWWRETGVVPRRAEHLMMKRVLGTGNAKRPFFEPYSIPINAHILRAHQAQLVERVQEVAEFRILRADNPRLWPNPTKDCSWRCDYQVVCPMVDNGMDWEDVLEQEFATKVAGE